MSTALSGSSGHASPAMGRPYTTLFRSATSWRRVASSGRSPFSRAFCGSQDTSRVDLGTRLSIKYDYNCGCCIEQGYSDAAHGLYSGATGASAPYAPPPLTPASTTARHGCSPDTPVGHLFHCAVTLFHTTHPPYEEATCAFLQRVRGVATLYLGPAPTHRGH